MEPTHTFDKGRIFAFDEAIVAKLDDMIRDLDGSQAQMGLFETPGPPPPETYSQVKLYSGSCLNVLPALPAGRYQAIITSPPYCNRYDYTRTYALEHALLGITESELLDLRQQMLSCTVENREKNLLELNPNWSEALNACDQNALLQTIITYLQEQKRTGALNNTGIPRMVSGYFYEMACVIQECFRLLKQGGWLFMVNDNVRYAGASISVDLILSRLAETMGFEVEQILVLPSGKGNSSQQMGVHGRKELRKCVYVLKKP